MRFSINSVCALALLAMSVGAVPPAVAQTYDPTGNQSADPYNPYSDQAQSRRRGANTDTNSDASAQPAPDNNSRYKPDEIDVTDRRTDDRDVRSSPDDRRDNAGPYSERSVRRVTPPSEFETYVSTLADKPIRRFGAELLVPAARGFTTPPTTTVPSDYRINPGDELVLGLSGSVEVSDLHLTVDSEGRIFVAKVGAVTVGGVRYGDVQGVVSRQVARQYASFRAAVSIARLHGITVFVTGFAATPGSYTLSSLSTLVNAVLAAGGPSAGGSFRSIQVRRNGRLVSDFDLYELLLKGDKSADILLQNGDVIYVAPAGAQVAVIGSVNNEAIYEASSKETLSDLLLYAGGVNTVADDSRLLVFDPMVTSNAGWEQLTPAQVQARVARRGEILRVLSGVGLARPLNEQPVLVTVSGEVARPGRYYLPPGTPLSAALEQAGGTTARAFPFATVLTRESVRLQQRDSYDRALRDLRLLLTEQPLTSAESNVQLQPARLAAVTSVVDQLKARKPEGRIVLAIAPDAAAIPGAMVLENNDTLYVAPRPVTVGVFGAVPSPASFEFTGNRRIGDYLKLAGGVQKVGDKSEIFVVRANGSLLAPRRGPFAGSILGQRALPGDLIFVPINANRGAFWARLRDISGILLGGAVAAASVSAVTK